MTHTHNADTSPLPELPCSAGTALLRLLVCSLLTIGFCLSGCGDEGSEPDLQFAEASADYTICSTVEASGLSVSISNASDQAVQIAEVSYETAATGESGDAVLSANYPSLSGLEIASGGTATLRCNQEHETDWDGTNTSELDMVARITVEDESGDSYTYSVNGQAMLLEIFDNCGVGVNDPPPSCRLVVEQ